MATAALHAQRLWDAALDEERRQMEADFDAAEQEYMEGRDRPGDRGVARERERTA